MGSQQQKRLRRPAFAKRLSALVGTPAAEILVEVHIGKQAWSRAKAGRWWRADGTALVVALDHETTVADYDFTCLDRLCVILDATDCSLEPAVACARRICEHGAHTVCLMHPRVHNGEFTGWAIYRGAPRP